MSGVVWLLAALAAALPVGSSRLDGPGARLFVHKPAAPARALLLVLHGTSRNAGTYRDNARPLAERLGAVAVAPRLEDRAAFRSPRTFALLDRVAAHVRAAEPVAGPTLAIGHSAGALLLLRLAAFADRIGPEVLVAANPSAEVWPPPDRIQSFLARPVVLLLGGRDARRAKNRALFERARTTAARLGVPFCWRMEIVAGVGHDHAAMFRSEEALGALGHRCRP